MVIMDYVVCYSDISEGRKMNVFTVFRIQVKVAEYLGYLNSIQYSPTVHFCNKVYRNQNFTAT